MNNQPHICRRYGPLHNLPMVAHSRSRGIAILSLNISTGLGLVISYMPWLLYSHEGGPECTVKMDGWALGQVQTIRRKRKSFTSHWGSNPAVQPVASHYTIIWNNQQMQLYAVNSIPLLVPLYMFRVFYKPIIRSTIFNCICSHWYKTQYRLSYLLPVWPGTRPHWE